MRKKIFLFFLILPALLFGTAEKPRVREAGIKIGIFPPGQWNAITDVAGVKVGHVTLIKGKNIRTGVTAVLPHYGNVFKEKVPGAISIANGYGKLTGISQVDELGTIETPIILTNTLSVPTAANAVITYILSLQGNEDANSVNPVVGETNDSNLNDIRGRHVKEKHVLKAIREAASGPVKEGCVGASTGTICFGYKGGIGTSSRILPGSLGGYTIGVLAQTNFGGVLEINGFPAGLYLKKYYYRDQLEPKEEGSCMMIVATDAPLDALNLKRLAKRALLGIARTGGFHSNGSGDYAIVFSTAQGQGNDSLDKPHNKHLSPLFLAAAEAAEEAILNSLFQAESMEGRDGHKAEAFPVAEILELIKKDDLK